MRIDVREVPAPEMDRGLLDNRVKFAIGDPHLVEGSGADDNSPVAAAADVVDYRAHRKSRSCLWNRSASSTLAAISTPARRLRARKSRIPFSTATSSRSRISAWRGISTDSGFRRDRT